MRFRLTAPHYLYVPGTKWRYEEKSQESGESTSVEVPVPKLLSPDDPKNCNYPGEVIISTKASPEHRRDIIVIGPTARDGKVAPFKPTPGMEPLDEEAEAAVAALRPIWDRAHIDSSTSNLSDSLITAFEAKMSELLQQQGGAVRAADPSVTELLKQVEALTAKVAELTVLKEPAPRRV